MGWSKRDFVNGALEEIGLGTYALELPPEQELMVLRRLDSMIAEWSARGIFLGWPLSSDPNAIDPQEQTNTSNLAQQAIVLGLAMRICAPFGKMPPDFLRAQAFQSLNLLIRESVRPSEMQMPGSFPLGSGNSQTACGAFTAQPIQSGDVDEPVSYDDL